MTRKLLFLMRFLAFPCLAFGGQWLWMQQHDPTSWSSLVWIPVLTYCWFCVGGLSHELIHQNLPPGPIASRVLGNTIGFAIGIPYTVYREVHMRHHAYLNTPLDWELWPYSDPHASLKFRRMFLGFDLLCGSLATPLIWGRICFSRRSPAKPEMIRRMQREYAMMFAAWLATAAWLTWQVNAGMIQLSKAMLIYSLPLVLAANCNSIRKIMEHVGTSSLDPLQGTRTIIGRSWVTRLLSFFDFDLSVHGPHHRYPKLSHDNLKNRMQELRQQDPDRSYPIYSSFTAALWDTAKAVWKNPGVGVNAGCPDDLSHLPGLNERYVPRDGEHVLSQPSVTAT
ncbi:MAG: hypothetical protein Fues2KO_06480 [Fuerstiella sp.]